MTNQRPASRAGPSEQNGGDARGVHGDADETVRWTAYPSWAHFIWLYCLSLAAGARGLLALRTGMSGWAVWLGGAAALLGCAAVLRRWARYSFTANRVIVHNGYTGREIQALPLDALSEIEVLQGPVAMVFNIGTVVLRSVDGDRILTLRGIRDPEVIKTRIEALELK